MKPRIFVSAVTSELGTARQLAAGILQRLGYDPVLQDIFGSDPGDLRQVLRDKIDDCDGLVQIVGRAYGAEPPVVDPEFGRVSYTQYEFLYARKRGKKTWLIFAEEGCTADRPLSELDLPAQADHADRTGYQAERRELQEAWRQRFIQKDAHLRHHATSDAELELKIERLKDEFSELRQQDRRWRKSVLWLVRTMAAMLVLALIGVFYVWWNQSAEDVTAARIRGHLIESSELARQKQLAEADKEPQYDERERLRDLAEEAHQMRLSRIDDLAKSFAQIENREDATVEFKEMARILTEESENAVDKALHYAQKRRTARLERIGARNLAAQKQNRADLQTDLKAASLEATRGQPEEARKIFQLVVELEPKWPEALVAFSKFLRDQSIESERHGTLENAMKDANQSFDLAQDLYKLDTENEAAKHVLSGACTQIGDLLSIGRNPGDADKAFAHYQQGLELAESVRKQNPKSDRARRDVSVSLERLGDFLADRRQDEDLKHAQEYYEHSLEIREELHAQDKKSALAARDLSVSLNKLGEFLVDRGQDGDEPQALAYFKRSLKVREDLYSEAPDSAEAARDVLVSCERLGDFLSQRDHAGDSDQALAYYQRSLAESEKLYNQNRTSAQASRDFSVCLNNLGNFLVTRGEPGDAEKTLTLYQRSLKLAEQVQQQNPDSAVAARDVAVSLNHLGDFLWQRNEQGDTDQALIHYKKSLELAATAWKQNRSAIAAWDVIFSQSRLGELLVEREQFEDASGVFKKGIAVLDEMIEMRLDQGSAKNEKTEFEQRIWFCENIDLATGDWDRLLNLGPDELSLLLPYRVGEFSKRGDRDEVAKAGAKLRELEPSTANNLYNAACAYAICLTITDQEDSHAADTKPTAQQYTELAIDCLKEAMEAGFDSFNHMRNDPDLAPLHGLPEFEALFPQQVPSASRHSRSLESLLSRHAWGNSVARMIYPRQCSPVGFNEAAFFWRGKGGLTHTSKLSHDASMRPRSFERGKNSFGPSVIPVPIASMRPRSFERGKSK